MLFLAVIFIRTIVIYMLLLAVMRLSGKRQIGEIQISELVTTFLLSDIASYPLTDPAIPLLNAVVPIFTIIPLEIIFSFLTTKSARLKKILDGNPSIIVLHGKIQKKEMSRVRLSMEDLLCELRLKNIASVSDVDYAIVEQNGQISVFQKKEAPLSHAVVIDGILNEKLLHKIRKNKHWLDQILQENKICDLHNIFLLSVTDDESVTLIRQNETEG
jgi:uncharacterized membrane protein YcaP (DUF421 family)